MCARECSSALVLRLACAKGRPSINRKPVDISGEKRNNENDGLVPYGELTTLLFALDVLACPRCGGRLRIIATIQDPAIVRAILAHLGLAPGPDSPGPAPPQPDHPAATG